jgi:hypothetical protein
MLTLPLTSRLLRDFRKCPQLFHRKQSGLLPTTGGGKVYLLENAARYLILKGREAFDEKYVIGGDRPINPKTGLPYGTETKRYAEWRATVEQEILTEQEGQTVFAIAAAVAAHDEAASLLTSGRAYVNADGYFCGLPAQSLSHWLSDDGVLVYVTIINDIDRFAEQACDYDYAHRMHFEAEVLDSTGEEVNEYRLIAAERCEPFRVGVWSIGIERQWDAAQENLSAAKQIAECQRTGCWPTNFETLQTLE